MLPGQGATADEISLFAVTKEICATNTAIDANMIGALADQGWSSPSKHDAEKAVKILADGLLLVGRDAHEPIDWSKGPEEMLQLAIQVAVASREQANFAFVTISHEAALAVFDLSAGGVTRMRCLYAGPGDESVRETLQALEALDKRSGRGRVDPNVQMFSSQSTNGKQASNYQAARFDASAQDMLGRPTAAEFAFSLVSSRSP